MAARLLLVEDEEHLQEVIKLNLEMEGYYVKLADNGKSALDLYKQERFDLLILDVMLPEIDGFEVCEQIRLYDSEIPILFLTAKNTSEDRINGLKKGADDYLTKPFNLEELILRVRNLIKRGQPDSKTASIAHEYQFGDNFIYFNSYEILGVNNKKQQLSKKEAGLLKLLIEKENEVVSRDEILQKVWGYDVYPSTRTIDNYILNFRKYFEANPKSPKHFHSIRGVGYKFTK
ncbi:MAG: response regulator transcription factor [Bacteroidia bacterium]|nr:response regulator transcription factor [Bacteroidia bacterium]